MADSEAKKKIMEHRRGVMLREANADGYLQQILADGEKKPALERIIDEVVRDESNSIGGLMHPEAVRRELKTRWTERQEQQADQPTLVTSL